MSSLIPSYNLHQNFLNNRWIRRELNNPLERLPAAQKYCTLRGGLRPKVIAHLIHLTSGQEGSHTDHITARPQTENGNKLVQVTCR